MLEMEFSNFNSVEVTSELKFVKAGVSANLKGIGKLIFLQ